MRWKANVIKLSLAFFIAFISFAYRKYGDNPFLQIVESSLGSKFAHLIRSRANQRCGVMKWDSFVIVSDRVVFPDGVRRAALHIVGDKIAGIGPENTYNLTHALNFRDAVIFPGLVDIHAHYNEPGREDWEGFVSGTETSLLGGATTAIEMPLNSDPTITDMPQLLAKIKVAKRKAHLNLGFWGGLIPENAGNHELLDKMVNAGVLGFKSFMSPSGIHDFGNVSISDLERALPFLKRRGLPLYVHAELVSPVPSPPQDSNPRHYATFLATRPAAFERRAIRALIDLLEADRSTPYQPGFRIHIAHLGDAESLGMIRAAKAAGLPLSVETCAHYLLFNAEDIPENRTEFKCMPPIRDRANRDALRAAVLNGDIDVVSSDHSPAPLITKFQKEGNFLKAWGGIVGNQYLLPATWTSLRDAYTDQGLSEDETLVRLAQRMSTAPAAIAGLAGSKGRIQEGFDADLTIWEPTKLANTSIVHNYNKNKLSPYFDTNLYGKVLASFVKGDLTAMNGRPSPRVCGSLILGRERGTN